MKKCEYCHKEFEYFDIVNHECRIERLDLLNDLSDFAEKINRMTSRNQLTENSYDKITDMIINIKLILKEDKILKRENSG
jgi:hypothetical protein